ncbi:hypothetical protein EA085_25120, partial [Salmonella enterica subsp. enterica serovar Give]|nr:hypothetical protein [Salmonella enterica subsp. enterica serovar Give]
GTVNITFVAGPVDAAQSEVTVPVGAAVQGDPLELHLYARDANRNPVSAAQLDKVNVAIAATGTGVTLTATPQGDDTDATGPYRKYNLVPDTASYATQSIRYNTVTVQVNGAKVGTEYHAAWSPDIDLRVNKPEDKKSGPLTSYSYDDIKTILSGLNTLFVGYRSGNDIVVVDSDAHNGPAGMDPETGVQPKVFTSDLSGNYAPLNVSYRINAVPNPLEGDSHTSPGDPTSISWFPSPQVWDAIGIQATVTGTHIDLPNAQGQISQWYTRTFTPGTYPDVKVTGKGWVADDAGTPVRAGPLTNTATVQAVQNTTCTADTGTTALPVLMQQYYIAVANAVHRTPTGPSVKYSFTKLDSYISAQGDGKCVFRIDKAAGEERDNIFFVVNPSSNTHPVVVGSSKTYNTYQSGTYIMPTVHKEMDITGRITDSNLRFVVAYKTEYSLN